MYPPVGALNQAVIARRPSYAAAPMLASMAGWQRPVETARTRKLLDVLRQIRDSNPDVSKAVENWITLANPGYRLTVYFAKKKGEGGAPMVDEEGLRLVQQFATRMCSEYSGAWDEVAGAGASYPGLDTFIGLCHLTAATQGAMAAEAELTENLDDLVDIYPVDPAFVVFRQNRDTLRLEPGMGLTGAFQPLDPIRFRYVPKDPDVNLPAGRSPLLAVLDTVFFQQQFLRELQTTVHQVNMPRLDVKIIQEVANNALQQTRPDLMAPGQELARQQFLDGFLADIQKTINGLEADDAFIHWDSVEAQFVNPGQTAVPIKDVMEALDKMIISGVKQLPILLGRNEGATTTHATVQWQVFVQQLGNYQRISRTLATWALNLYLRVQGRQSYCVLEYHKHKTSDAFVEAQALSLNAQSWGLMVDRGWGTNDEAAQALLNHPATGTPATTTAEPTPAASRVLTDEQGREIKGNPLPPGLATVVREFSPTEIASLYEAFRRLPTLDDLRHLLDAADA